MSEDIIRTNPPINAMDFGVPPLFAERAENYARWAVAAERERVMQIAQSMKADLEAKFEKAYMEGAMAGAAAEREACAKVCEEMHRLHFAGPWEKEAATIRARSQP